jgi:glycosyltransferase involved in cell wall biosynthesis
MNSPTSLHIVQTIDDLSAKKGGPSRTVLQLSQELQREPTTRVSMVCRNGPIATAPAPENPSTGQSSQPSIVRASSMLSALRRVVANNSAGARVLHDNGMWLSSNFAAATASAIYNVPLVITPHGMLEPWALQHHRWKKSLAMAAYQRWCFSRAAVLHATSEQEAAHFRRAGLSQPIAVISNGIAQPLSANVPQLEHRVALFLSRVHPKKGILDLLRAWSVIRPHGWRLRIVGPDDGAHLSKVLKDIEALGLHQDVEIVGEVDDDAKWQHYRQASVFVLPTYSENFGLVIGEALACGVPVITTTATPWHEIRQRGCGWIVEPGLSGLIDALGQATALSHEALASKGRLASEWIPSQYSWPAIAAQMRELYGWVIAGLPMHSRPSFLFNG